MTEKIKAECLRRMKALKLHDEGVETCVGDFRKTGRPWKSEAHGILYWLDEEEQKWVKDFEEKHKDFELKVYHCYRTMTPFAEVFYMLFCTNQANEGAEFDDDLKDGIIYCYAKNLSSPLCSEFGSCYIQSKFGGVDIY